MYFEIDMDWKEMSNQCGITGQELKIRIISDEVVGKDFILEKLKQKVGSELRDCGDTYRVEIYDGSYEYYLKSEVVEVIRSKIERNGLNKRGGNYEMKFSIKFDNQGWWPDET